MGWFLRELAVDGMSGQRFIRNWPRPGGVARNFAKLVAAVDVLMGEMEYLPKRKPDKKAKE